MNVLFVSRRQELANLLQYHLGPIGFEVEIRTEPSAVIADFDREEVPIILFDVDDFPRHWKPLALHLRAFRPRNEAVFVLLTSKELPPEEVAKATHLGINGIVTEEVTEKRGAHRLLDLLRRYKLLQDKRSFTRYDVTDNDRVGMAFIHPVAGRLVTGVVTEISVKGVSLAPDHPERCADLAVGTDLAACSLRIGGDIVSVDCRVMRAGRDMGLQFVSFDEGAHDAVRSYIQARPERALRAAIEASRSTSGEAGEQ